MSVTRVLVVCTLLFVPPAGLGEPLGCPESAEVVAEMPALGAEGLSADFRTWIEENGYAHFDFPRDDLAGGSYGGREFADQPLQNQPVVFVHGNSDRAAGEGSQGPYGWTAVLRQFLAAGYVPAELYATTWGQADPEQAGEQVHSLAYVQRIRAFLEAVLAYTGAERLDVVAHSMGVTLARRAILGGDFHGQDLGPPLTDRVDTFVGIAGANRGLAACYYYRDQPTCSDRDGFFPGRLSFWGLAGLSDVLEALNSAPGFEGQHVYSIWSAADQLIGFGGLVYGRYTSRIPEQDGEKVYSTYPYGHFCVRDLSARVQLEMVRDQRVP